MLHSGYKALFAARMRRLDRYILDAIMADLTWGELFDKEGLTYEKKGN